MIMDADINLPMPTKENPYIQVKYVFNLVANTKISESTQSNYRNGLSYYLKYLNETKNYNEDLSKDPRFFLNEQWDEYCFLKVEQYVKQTNTKGQEGYLSSTTLPGIFTSIRAVMEFTFFYKLAKTKDFIDINILSGSRETDSHTAYSDNEYNQIIDMTNKEMRYIRKILNEVGKKKTNVGKDPRIINRKAAPRGTKLIGEGWKSIDNVRWYFENEMNCVPLPGIIKHKEKHGSFFQNVTNNYKHYGGFNGIYKRWGVTSQIRADILMPLAIKLIAETGLNPESLWGLEVDCFQEEHPLSGVPYLKYFKKRSGGEKEFHLLNDETLEFRETQANIVKYTINQIIALTNDLRKKAPAYKKNKLFLYESNSTAHFGKLNILNVEVSSNWCKNMVDEYNLLNDEGDPLVFNLTRFRPTKITKLVEDGVDFFDIQHQAGHADIKTTLNYIDKNKLDTKSKERTHKAIKKISENKLWAETKDVISSDNNKNSHIYKGILSDCRNPYDPPKEIQNLASYQPSQACNRYNMCLFCHNVIIFKHHLPLIASYRRQIITALSVDNAEIPNDFIYRQTLDVINELLDPNKSEFDEKDISQAIEDSERNDYMIDPYVYKPIINSKQER